MNWTGGDLTRAAPTKAKALQSKQKAHFARARAGMLQRSGSQDQPALRHQRSTSARAIDFAEYQLLQRRQELLSRPDWLQLQATKPLDLQFESKSDKALVGKRRRVKDSLRSRRHKIREHRRDVLDQLPSHAVHALHQVQQPDSSMRILIGTDALNSGTQNTRIQQKRTVSEHLSDLSEEPMLLDSDDDLFEKIEPDQDRVEISKSTQHERHTYHRVETARILSGTSTGSAVPWSTSILDARSDVSPVVKAKEQPADESGVAEEKEWRGTLGIDATSLQSGSIVAQHFLTTTQQVSKISSAKAKPFPYEPTDWIGSTAPSTQMLRSFEHVSKQATTSKDERDLTRIYAAPSVHSISPHLIKPAIAQMIPPTSTAISSPAGEEESWKRFILGNSRSDSEDSVLTYHSRRLPSQPAPSGMLLSEAASDRATRGVPSVFRGYVQPIPPSTSKTDRTTAAIASSSSIY